MSDDDSGVDSENESEKPMIVPRTSSAPVVIAADLDLNGTIMESNFDQIESIETESNSTDDATASMAGSSSGDLQHNNLNKDKGNCSVHASSNNEVQSTSPSSVGKNDVTDSDAEEGMQISTANNSESNASSSSSSSSSSISGEVFQKLGFHIKLQIDEDTMSNLNSFYQNNVVQHEFYPKMMKIRKHRLAHYEHLMGEKQLRTAANTGDCAAVWRLLKSGVNVNAFDERKRTALHFAACHGNFNIAYALLDYGADPNQQDVIGNTPLHLAVCSSKLDIVILLLKNGANCNAPDNTGRTPLQLTKSKLAMMAQTLANSKTLPTVNFRLESMKISIMLGIYFEKCNEKNAEVEVIKERLMTHQTNEEIEQDVNDLLKCFNDWSIK